MLIGASLYAMFIGHMATLINTVDSASRQYDEKVYYMFTISRVH